VNLLLEITAGPEQGRTFQLSDNQVLRVGRTEKADVALSRDKSLSGQHFSLQCTDSACHIKDLNSLNGTFVNGRRITDAVLKTGDEIVAGETRFIVSIIEAGRTASPPQPSGMGLAGTAQVAAVGTTPQVATVAAVTTMRPAAADNKSEAPESRPSRVARSPRRFYVELYEEHLEEASFLYAQRLTLYDDPEVSWLTVGEWDERLEAHIDALVVGEDLALEVCAKQAAQGDFGELFAAVCVFCRQRRFDLLRKSMEALDLEDQEKLQAMADALKYECPVEWQPELLHVLPPEDPRMRFLQATLCGYRRMRGPREWARIGDSDLPFIMSRIAWACGRVGNRENLAMLRDLTVHQDMPIRSAATLSTLRLGDHQFVARFLESAAGMPMPWQILAVGGPRSLVNVLLNRVATPSTDVILALGLLGDIAAVPALLTYLSQEKLAAAAALALNVMTGAELYEKAFIPEVMEEDELFEEEKDQVKKDQPVLRPDGKPYGENVVRLSQNPEELKAWWTANKLRFSAGQRYRSGMPLAPGTLVENMAFEKTQRLVRQSAYEELVIRYGADIPFETDMPVKQQQDVIAKWKAWVAANENRFRPGEWYLGGQVMAS
jgi:uncharacterized protein (TIGR02270 family)